MNSPAVPSLRKAGFTWASFGHLLVTMTCLGSALYGAYCMHDMRSRPQATIVLNPPLMPLGDESGINYVVAPALKGSAWMTVAEALKQPAAQGMTEDQLRGAIISGRVQGPGSKKVMTYHAAAIDWIVPQGFKVVPPGTLLPSPGSIKIPPTK